TGASTQTSISVTGTQTNPGAIDFSHLSDVSASFSGVYGRTSFNQGSNVLYADLAVRNAGSYPANAPLLVGITHISDPSVRVRGQAGTTPDGIPYYDFTSLVAGGTLQANEVTGSQTIAFSDPNRMQFTYDLVILASLDPEPAFDTIPDI